MSAKTLIGLIVILVAALVASGALYTVHQTERAILLEFGNMVEADLKPGLHFKLPIAQEVKKFDARVLTLDTTAERYYTLGEKAVDRGLLRQMEGRGCGQVL